MGSKVTGFSIFSDDLREEVGNRYTLVGAIFGGLEFPQFPTVIPKLGICATAFQPSDDLRPFKFRVEMVVHGAETTILMEQGVDPTDYPPPDSRAPAPSDGIRKATTQLNMVLSPVTLSGPARIRVIADCEGEITYLGELDFLVQGDAGTTKQLKREIRQAAGRNDSA